MPRDNFHTVHMRMETVLVECAACERRFALGKAELPMIRQGNMQPVAALTYRCRRCGGTAVRLYVPATQDQIDFFLAGDPAGTMRRAT